MIIKYSLMNLVEIYVMIDAQVIIQQNISKPQNLVIRNLLLLKLG